MVIIKGGFYMITMMRMYTQKVICFFVLFSMIALKASSGFEDYYAFMGIARSASSEEIKKAYRKKALLLHPDKPSGNEEQFKKLGNIYATLSDPSKKMGYDREYDFNSGGGAYFSGFPSTASFTTSSSSTASEKKFKCDNKEMYDDFFNFWKPCEKNFSTQQEFEEHQRTVHHRNKSAVFTCNDMIWNPYVRSYVSCGQSFGTEQDLDNHKRTINHASSSSSSRASEKNFKCDNKEMYNDFLHLWIPCEKIFSTQQEFEEHQRTVHHRNKSAVFTCNDMIWNPYVRSYVSCGQSFGTQQDLDNHKRTTPHTPSSEGQNKEFACKVFWRSGDDVQSCNEKFGSEAELKEHMRVIHKVNQ